MFDQSTHMPVAGLLFWAAFQGAVAQRVVAFAWRRSLAHELTAGAAVMLLSYLVWAEDHASPAALSLLGVTLIINALAVLLAHRFQPPDPPVRL